MVVRRSNLGYPVSLGYLTRLAKRVQLRPCDTLTCSGRPAALQVSLGYLRRVLKQPSPDLPSFNILLPRYRLGEGAVSECYSRASSCAPQATWGGSMLLQPTTYLPGHLGGVLLSKEQRGDSRTFHCLPHYLGWINILLPRYRLGEGAVSECYSRASSCAPQATWSGSMLLQPTTYLPGHLGGVLLSKEYVQYTATSLPAR